MKVLFLYPNKWGLSMTPIWVASHNGVLKKNGFQTDIFDCTFFSKCQTWKLISILKTINLNIVTT